jgi:hypothetical protein
MPSPPNRLRNFSNIAEGRFDVARALGSQLPDRRRLETDILIALNHGTLPDLRKALEAAPSTWIVTTELYEPLLEVLESREDALAVLKAAFADSGKMWPDKYHDIALLSAYYGDPEFALAVLAREIPYTTIRFTALWYPVMAEARQRPEFNRLVTEVNLVDYWRTYGWADYCQPQDDDFVCY